jgi:hypothetical protein
MIPGAPAGDARFGGESDDEVTKAPTLAELAEIIDEFERCEELSSDAWVGLRRHAQTLEYTAPVEVGWLTCRPDPSEFHPDDLIDQVGDERVAALLEGAVPTADEIVTWQETRMNYAESEGGCGIRFPVLYWHVKDDRGRTMCLATLHGDNLEFERVAGLFRSFDDARQSLRQYGRLE